MYVDAAEYLYSLAFFFEFLNSTTLMTSSCDITIMADFYYYSYSWYSYANLTEYASFVLVSTDNDPYDFSQELSTGDEGIFCAIDMLATDLMFSSWDCTTMTVNFYEYYSYIGWDTTGKLQTERGTVLGDSSGNFYPMSVV